MKGEETRARILDAARRAFAGAGYAGTSVRGIASEVGVDQSLVHHYFGTKRELFIAAVDIPMDPDLIAVPLSGVPDEEFGEAFARLVLDVWDSERGPAVISAIRAHMDAPDQDILIRQILDSGLLGALAPRIDRPKGSAQVRLSLAFTQLMGLLMMRKIMGVEPVASMPADRLAAIVGPTFQRYLLGDLPG